MAPSNFSHQSRPAADFQPLIIDDSWEGTIYLEARLIKSWQGLCGSNRLLEDRQGRFYWWTVLLAPEGGEALQRLVAFLDWDSMAEALGITEAWGQDHRAVAGPAVH